MPACRQFTFALLVLLSLCLAAGPASAGGASKDEEPTSGGLFNAPREVDLPMLVVPVGEGGKLHRYAYVALQLEVLGADVWQVREKIPFIQDAFIREVFSASVARADNPEEIDEDSLKARLKERATGVLQDDTVKRIIIKQVAYANN